MLQASITRSKSFVNFYNNLLKANKPL